MRRPSQVLALLAAVAIAGWSTAGVALADGEVGLVIQEGSTVKTYCIGYTGDGISGDQLLRAAGQTFDAYGGGSGLAVCSIGQTGCGDSGSFASCFCQCQGAQCVYWAFFTRSYGKQWVYSSLAFNLLKAKDGDVHGWKWGAGGPNSAPAPQDVTFEQICGHAPRGGQAPTVSATLPPTSVATAPGQSTVPPPTATGPAPTEARTPPTSQTRTTTASPATTSTSLVTLTDTPEPPASSPATADGKSDNDGPGAAAIGALAVVGGGFIAAIGWVAFTRWRR